MGLKINSGYLHQHSEQVDQFVPCLPLENCDCVDIVEVNNNKFHKHQVLFAKL